MRSRADRVHAHPVGDRVFGQAESPRVDPRTGELFWIDMAAGVLHTGEFADGRLATTRSLPCGAAIGAAAPMAGPGDGWLVGSGLELVHLGEDGARTVVTRVPDSSGGGLLLNDGICAPDGAFWIGTQASPRRPVASLFRVGAQHVDRVLSGVTVSNGIGFSPDGTTLYYIDTLPHRRLEAFDVVDGRLVGRRTVAVLDHGNPDGLTVDDEGGIWVAMWDAGEVCRVSPGGTIDVRVELAVPRPTAVALSDGILFVTTARSDGVADSGRVFAADVGVSAPPTPVYRGDLGDAAAQDSRTPAPRGGRT